MPCPRKEAELTSLLLFYRADSDDGNGRGSGSGGTGESVNIGTEGERAGDLEGREE